MILNIYISYFSKDIDTKKAMARHREQNKFSELGKKQSPVASLCLFKRNKFMRTKTECWTGARGQRSKSESLDRNGESRTIILSLYY